MSEEREQYGDSEKVGEQVGDQVGDAVDQLITSGLVELDDYRHDLLVDGGWYVQQAEKYRRECERAFSEA